MENLSKPAELNRLFGLSELDLDYDSLQTSLKDFTDLAAGISGAQVGLVNLIDRSTQWTVASSGIELKQMPREDSACQYTIAHDAPTEFPSLKTDERFKDKFYVCGGPEFDYYFGVPLKTSEGLNIGALCVLHPHNLDLPETTTAMFSSLARQVVGCLERVKERRFLVEELEVMQSARRRLCHDIRGPIGGIVGLSDAVVEELRELGVPETKEIEETLGIIRQGAESVLQMAEDIFSKEAVRDFGLNTFTCRTLATRVRALCGAQASAKGCRLEIQAKDPPTPIPFQQRFLCQIIGNLVSNGIKFTEQGGWVRVEIQVQPSKNLSQCRLHITVADSGRGMSAGKLAQIREGVATSEPGTLGESGFGFGLALVVNLVQKCGGRIDVESEEGKGTCFQVHLPLT